jgi:hypothetical protein
MAAYYDLAGDGYAAPRLFSQGVSYTYDDVIFLPGFIDFAADAVDLSTRLSRRVPLSIPCVASPMDTVSEAAMASLGGAAVVHGNTEAQTQASIVGAASRSCPPCPSSRRPPLRPSTILLGTSTDSSLSVGIRSPSSLVSLWQPMPPPAKFLPLFRSTCAPLRSALCLGVL